MDFPSEGRGGARLSAETLDKMTVSELRDALDRALDSMTDETYDNSMITALLSALEKKEPLPHHPGAQESYDAFTDRLSGIVPDSAGARSGSQAERHVARHILKSGLVAAVIAVSLFMGMIAVQAAGVDVFGAIARWTDSVFSFGDISPESDSSPAAATGEPLSASVLEEIERYLPSVPSGFVKGEPFVYVDADTNSVEYFVLYSDESNYIQYSAVQYDNRDVEHRLYEKDSRDVEVYEINNIDYYVFTNNNYFVAVWYANEFEYCISTDMDMHSLKQIISAYEETGL